MSKILSVHQPNFIPWVGYFHKILVSDVFVILDEVQFITRSVGNRNKIKIGDGKQLMLTVPIKLSEGSRKNYLEMKIAYDQKWTDKMLKTLKSAYQKSPYFIDFYDDLASIFKEKHGSIAALNISIIKYIIEKLNIKSQIYLQSVINKNLGKKNDRIINLCKYYNADIYLSGTGARKYNNPELYRQNDIQLKYQEFNHPIYPQLHGEFVSHLSVIDMLFNAGAEKSREYLEMS